MAGCRRLTFRPGVGALVWMASISGARPVLPGLLSVLEGAELRRLSEISEPARAEAYAIGHGLLRHILSEATDGVSGPGEWRFSAGENGKPTLGSERCRDHDVSLSYSSGVVAMAVARQGWIGIDIEAVYPGPIPWALLDKREQQKLQEIPADARAVDFLRLWTAKEAAAKCRGAGLGEEISGAGEEILHVEQLRHYNDRFVLAIATADVPVSS